MPFESSLPLVVACLAVAAVAGLLWSQTGHRGPLIAAGLALAAAVAVFAADRLVETDREQLLALFPRLARAAEQRDVATLLAALDPELRPIRAEAERAVRQVQPTAVTITRLDVAVDSAATPPTARADMIVKVTGNVFDKAGPGTALVAVKATLRKKDGVWLVTDAEVDQARPGAGP